jgi:hypothetical protein
MTHDNSLRIAFLAPDLHEMVDRLIRLAGEASPDAQQEAILTAVRLHEETLKLLQLATDTSQYDRR